MSNKGFSLYLLSPGLRFRYHRVWGYGENLEEQQAIGIIKMMRQAGKSLRAIGAKLTELGYKTKRNGAKWYAATIKGILENDIHQEAIA